MRVTHVLRYDAGLYRGGGEIKAQRTREALAELGVDVRVFEPLNDDLGDIVHFFGSMGYYWTLAQHCQRLKVPYVCSPIFVTPRSPGRLRWRRFRLRLLEGKSNLSRLFGSAEELYFQTGREQVNFEAFYGAARTKIRVPNGVESRFAKGDADAFRRHFHIERPFVLQTGTLGPNKHQLDLIRAVQDLDVDLVLMGRVNDARYLEACRKDANNRVHFLDPVPHDDPLLPGAYAAAEIFCLPSSDDIFANAAMEAAAAGCRLVLGDGWGGQEIYGDWAKWVEPDRPDQIRRAIQAARSGPHEPNSQSRHFLAAYAWESVAAVLKTRYEGVTGSFKNR